MKKHSRKKKDPVTAETPLTFREKRFVDALFMTTPPFNGSEAARAVGFSETSCRVQAVRLLTKDNVQAAIKSRQADMDKQSAVTREQWLKKAERFYYADVRKMIDEHGNVLAIPEMGDNEASLIAGFEIVEEFTQVERVDGKKKAEQTGYTKKFKLVDPMKAHEYYGKIRGFINDEIPENDEALKSLTIAFVNSKGERVDPKTIGHTRPTRVIEHRLDGPPFKLAR